ncbi:hypothetical protein L596_021119 [Steinernema carpocapsae]|uniref:Uncharacterized protein n=1 Tax=Steinernema carpocapsae TaxID=34508 RepID=A0A4U5MVS4_STECR|nr:hypothetical protein L596_021119 [Steinernema carpocapsae]
MDQLPYAFIDNVAALHSAEFVNPFEALDSRLWSTIGETHRRERRHFILAVKNCSDGTDLSLLTRNREFPLSSVLSRNLSYVSIYGIFLLQLNFVTSKFHHDLKSFLQNVRVRTLKYLCSNCNTSSVLQEMECAWKLPTEILKINTLCPKQVLAYHLFENSYLKKILLTPAKFSFIIMIANSWKAGEMQEIDEECDCLSGEDLIKFGFTKHQFPNTFPTYEMSSTVIRNGEARTLCFVLEY